MRSRLFAVACALSMFGAGLVASAQPAHAVTIERVVSPGGIEAWLVREQAVPLVAMSFAFEGGSSQDPAEKAGLGTLTAGLLDEGAGDLDSGAFQQRLADNAIELRFSSTRDYLMGSIRVLSDRREAGIDLLRMALNQPRFDTTAIERVRGKMVANLRSQSTDPNHVANVAWSRAAFPDHPYGRPTNGTFESVPKITADDIKDFHRRVLARDNLKVVVVGDIDAKTLGAMLDLVFGGLPEKAQLEPVPDVTVQGLGRRVVVDLDVPQSVMILGGHGPKRHDPAFIPAFVANHILGGGSFSSRLYQEIRERRGLTYGIYSYLHPLDHAALFVVSTQTQNERAGEALTLVEAEIARLADKGPTAQELREAKDYLKGSFALRFDTSTRIAAQLLAFQLQGLGIDYINRRNELIEAVTIDEARRAAKLLAPDGMLVTVVGRPKGIQAREIAN